MTYVIIGLVVIALVVVVVLATRKSSPELPPAEDQPKLDKPKAEKAKGDKPKADKPRADKPKADKSKSEKKAADKAPKQAEAADESAPTGADAAPEKAPAAEKEADKSPAVPPAAAPVDAFEGGPDVSTLRRGLARSRDTGGFFGRLKALFVGRTEIDESISEEIEEVLLTSDVGVKTTEAILARVKERLEGGDLSRPDRVWDVLREEASRILNVDGKAGPFQLQGQPTVVLMVGVNGAGKTTTIGKLATRLKDAGKTCVLAAGDTFRAAAVQQLVIWGERVGCDVVKGKDGADPSAVIFDAVEKAKETGADVVLADTAGRLHTKTNLMAEMTKIFKSTQKALPGAPHEVLLVLDATNGQNALAQAREFREALDLTGIVLTKLDGTAKGGVMLGICDELQLPIRFVGLGERPADLHDFAPAAFVEALLGKEADADAA